jgi:hypothetical protein
LSFWVALPLARQQAKPEKLLPLFFSLFSADAFLIG